MRSWQANLSDGFTLLELLVAMTLMALLSIALFGGLHFGRKVWETTQSSTLRINDVRRLEEFLGDALTRAYPAMATAEATQAHVEFSGGEHSLRFLAPDPQTDGALAYIDASSDGDAIALHVAAELGDSVSGSVVGKSLRGTLELSYYGEKKGTQEPKWYRDWQNQPHLPSLVRMNIEGPGGAASTATVALRVDAPADCVFDPLTQDCQER